MKKVLIQAHRGASAYAPENTLPAFQMAVDMGADGIECDIHMSKDGQFVVCHDTTVDRVSNGSGAIADMTLREIKALDFGSSFSEKYRGVTAPTLDEMLVVVGGMKVINIEIKRFEHEMGLVQALTLFHGCLEKHGVLDRVIVSSFDAEALSALKRLYPDMPICLLYSKLRYACHKAEKMNCRAIHPHFVHLTAATVRRAHNKGMQVNCWTPNTEQEILSQIRLGCDGIITNYPDKALKLLKENADL